MLAKILPKNIITTWTSSNYILQTESIRFNYAMMLALLTMGLAKTQPILEFSKETINILDKFAFSIVIWVQYMVFCVQKSPKKLILIFQICKGDPYDFSKNQSFLAFSRTPLNFRHF